MAKKESKPMVGNYRRHGWVMKAAKFSEMYTQVTPANRKAAIVVGRVLYVFHKDKGDYRYAGFMEIWPRITGKGMIQVSNHPVLEKHDFFASGEIAMEEYKTMFEPLLTNKIEEGVLYIIRDDKIVKYQKLNYDKSSTG